MRWAVTLVSLLLMGSLSSLNSPGSAQDSIEADAASLEQYIAVAEEMHARWAALDGVCDEDAVFALLYLITTGAVGDLVAADHFEDNPMLVDWDEDFAWRYLDAYDAYHDGDPATSVPEPWRIAFEHADSGDSTVTQNLLLGMNAHVNYDLAFSAEAMGLPQQGLKDDYDRVNDAFWNVPIPQSNEYNKRYQAGEQRDPDGELSLADEAIVETLISWREEAWIHATALAQAPTPLARQVVASEIEAAAVLEAQAIIAADDGSQGEFQAHCQASGHPPLPAAYGGEGYGDDWSGAVETFYICHARGSEHEQTMYYNEKAWKGHRHHGDTKGAC